MQARATPLLYEQGNYFLEQAAARVNVEKKVGTHILLDADVDPLPRDRQGGYSVLENSDTEWKSVDANVYVRHPGRGPTRVTSLYSLLPPPPGRGHGRLVTGPSRRSECECVATPHAPWRAWGNFVRTVVEHCTWNFHESCGLSWLEVVSSSHLRSR